MSATRFRASIRASYTRSSHVWGRPLGGVCERLELDPACKGGIEFGLHRLDPREHRVNVMGRRLVEVPRCGLVLQPDLLVLERGDPLRQGLELAPLVVGQPPRPSAPRTLSTLRALRTLRSPRALSTPLPNVVLVAADILPHLTVPLERQGARDDAIEEDAIVRHEQHGARKLADEILEQL